AVTVVCVLTVSDRIKADNGATAKLAVRATYAGIDYVSVNPGAGWGVSVLCVERQIALIDPIEPPRRIVLRSCRCHRPVFFDILNPVILAQSFGVGLRHFYSEPVEGMLVDVFDVAAVEAREVSCHVWRDGIR